MKRYDARCEKCGYRGTYDSQAQAAYALTRHSCAKHLAAGAARNRRARERAQRPVRECGHKQARHQHGDRAMYVLDKCRCAPCTAAAAKYEQARELRRLRGHAAYVDATPAVDHLRALQAAGLGWKRVAHLASIPASSVYPLLYGRPDRNGGRPRTKARPATVDAILAVPLPTLTLLADGAKVPATGTRRRLQALATLGWSVARLATHAGTDRQALDRALTADLTLARTAKTVAALYDRLWDTPPQPRDRTDQAGITRTIARAQRLGWVPPLAWDDADLDDPHATPSIGQAPTGRRKRVHVDDVEFLLDADPALTVRQLADRLRVTPDGVHAALTRAGRHDLLQTLTRNAEVAA